jgi:hypothetical protein
LPSNQVDKGESSVCQHVSCRKSFSKPLKVTNSSQPQQEPYDACPYCLTRIEPVIISSSVEAAVEKESDAGVFNKPQNCPYYMGYLNEPDHKDKFADECLVCTVILQCMKK